MSSILKTHVNKKIPAHRALSGKWVEEHLIAIPQRRFTNGTMQRLGRKNTAASLRRPGRPVDHAAVRAFNDRQRHQEVTEYNRIKHARVVIKTIYKSPAE